MCEALLKQDAAGMGALKAQQGEAYRQAVAVMGRPKVTSPFSIRGMTPNFRDDQSGSSGPWINRR